MLFKTLSGLTLSNDRNKATNPPRFFLDSFFCFSATVLPRQVARNAALRGYVSPGKVASFLPDSCKRQPPPSQPQALRQPWASCAAATSRRRRPRSTSWGCSSPPSSRSSSCSSARRPRGAASPSTPAADLSSASHRGRRALPLLI